MKPRFFAAAWSELCGEEQELVLQQLAEAGREAARETIALEGPGSLQEEAECFAAYRRMEARSLGGRQALWERSVTRDDLRVAAFCVAFADERRRLMGLPPVPDRISWLVQSVAQAERLYYAALILGECRQAQSARLKWSRERACARRLRNCVPVEPAELLSSPAMQVHGSPETDSAYDAWRRAGDVLALVLMRLNLRTAGQACEIRRLYR
jgi:hypothetical protein